MKAPLTKQLQNGEEAQRGANNELSEVCGHLMPVTNP